MHKLVLLRHGESTWNRENRFTGWTDVELSDRGRDEAREAGRLLKEGGYVPDIAFTSVLKRAIDTLEIALDVLGLKGLPIVKSWRLNERHYGALQGLNKAETAAKHGEAQVKIWRRSYDIPPPPLAPDDERHPSRDARYASLKPGELPLTESLKDTVARFLPYWHDTIAPGDPLRPAGVDRRARQQPPRARHVPRSGLRIRHPRVEYSDWCPARLRARRRAPSLAPLLPGRSRESGGCRRACRLAGESVKKGPARSRRTGPHGRREVDRIRRCLFDRFCGFVRRDPERAKEPPVVGGHLEGPPWLNIADGARLG